MQVKETKIAEFRHTIWEFYKKNKRVMPWRNTLNQYYVVLSEVMLQQTQVPRVLTKFIEFIDSFPSFEHLAKANTKDLLLAWQGMGYNRRALYLQKTAQIIVNEYGAILPKNVDIVDSFPGIGPATASSIVTFAYNIPTVFIETNIRRVFIHYFFQDRQYVDDKDIAPLVQATLDVKNPREWYYALMDYGTYLVKVVENPNRRSKHYSVQSDFKSSDRRIRGIILRELLKHPLDRGSIISLLKENEDRVDRIISGLEKEGFVMEEKGIYRIK